MLKDGQELVWRGIVEIGCRRYKLAYAIQDKICQFRRIHVHQIENNPIRITIFHAVNHPVRLRYAWRIGAASCTTYRSYRSANSDGQRSDPGAGAGAEADDS